jgi:hypothetical protein
MGLNKKLYFSDGNRQYKFYKSDAIYAAYIYTNLTLIIKTEESTGLVSYWVGKQDKDEAWSERGGKTYTVDSVYDIHSNNFAGQLQYVTPSVSHRPVNTYSATHILSLADDGAIVTMANTADASINIPRNEDVAFPIGTEIKIYRAEAGEVAVYPYSGVTLHIPENKDKIANQYDTVTLLKVAENVWDLSGSLKDPPTFRFEINAIGGGGITSETKLMLHCDANPFVDAMGHTVTNMGNTVTLDTGVKKFGTGSAKMNSSGWSEGLSFGNSADYQFGTGDFTVDFWVNGEDGDTDAIYYVDNYNEGLMINRSGGALTIYSGSGSSILAYYGWNPVSGTWYHIAVTRKDGILRAFIDGVLVGAVEHTLNMTTASVLKVGLFMTGYMDEVRVLKGTAAWINNFTPPVAPYSAPDPFILPLPVNSPVTLDMMVDWGDGSEPQHITSVGDYNALNRHSYDVSGSYVIAMSGTCTGFSFKDQSTYAPNNKQKVTALLNVADLGFTTLDFYECYNLTSISGEFANIAGLTNAKQTFYRCYQLEEIPGTIFENCTGIDTFEETFYGCQALTSIPSNLFDNQTNATTFKGTFYNCANITAIPVDLFKNNTLVETFESTFEYCERLVTIPADLFKYNTAVTSFKKVFKYIAATSIPADLFKYNVAVVDMSYVFSNDYYLESIPADIFKYNTLVETLEGVLEYNYALTEIPVDTFRYNTVVTTFENVFKGCNHLATLPVDLFRYNTAVTTFKYAFGNCLALTSVSADLFKYNTLVTDMSFVFQLSGLTTVPADLFKYNTIVTNMFGVFAQNYQLTTVPAGIFRYNIAVTNMMAAFLDCYILASIPTDLFKYNTLVTNMSYLFRHDALISQVLDGDMFETNTVVETFERAFEDCRLLTGDGYDTIITNAESNVPTVVGTDCFAGAVALDGYPYSIDVDWGGQVISVPLAPSGLFATAISTTEIDLTWSAPNPRGSAIVGYKIERESPIGGGFSVLVANTGNVDVVYSDTTCSLGTQYNYRVSAINGIGTSEASYPANATTLSPLTSLLLHCDASPFVDELSHAITNMGSSVTLDIASKKFGDGSINFNGTTSYIGIEESEDFHFGTGAFTIDFWVNFTALPTGEEFKMLFNTANAGALWGVSWLMLYLENRDSQAGTKGLKVGLFADYGGGRDYRSFSEDLSNLSSYSTGVWYHVALVKNGDNWYLFRDGVQVSTMNLAVDMEAYEIVEMGRAFYDDCYTNCKIDEVRISKGIARWTSNFTPPTSAYSVDSYTKLLLHGDVSPIVDETGKTITNHNATVAEAIKKFGPGSAKFNGTSWSEGLSTPSDDSLQFGTGDFTVDFWVRGEDGDTDAIFYVDNYNEGIMISRSNTQLQVYSGSGSSILDCPWNPVSETWYHVALTRESGILRLFSNGTKIGQVECSRDMTTSSVRKIGLFMTGRMDEVRVSKGIARWVANFTPPTEPYTVD